MAPDLLTYDEAARLLGGVSARSVRRLVAAGKLRAYRITERTPRIDAASVRAYIRQSAIAATVECLSGKTATRIDSASCVAATSLRAALERAKKR